MRRIGMICVGAAGCLLNVSLATAGVMGSMPISTYGFHAVGTLFGGVASLNPNHSRTYVGTDDQVFVYNARGNSTTTGFVGGFLGAERQFAHPGLFMQAGLEYDYFGHGNARGINAVGIEPVTSTLYNYSYTLQSQQLLAVGKLFTTLNAVSHPFYPYVSVGLGAAFNRANQYTATTQETGNINLTPSYQNNTNTAFSYAVGLGVDTSVNQHVRVGVAYRFSDFGKSSLSNGQIIYNQYTYPTSFSLSVPHIYTNQFVAQISYVV